MSGPDGFWEPVRSNVVDCFQQFFDYVLPRESLAVVRLVAHCLRERLAWCDPDGTPRSPREVVPLSELDDELELDRKSVRAALERAVAARYLDPVLLPDEEGGGPGFRLRLDLSRFTLESHEFDGFYPLPTHRIRVPLEFFTTVVSQETLATIKVVACIIRMTLGSIDNLGRSDVSPAISQQQFVRRMNMGRRQAIQGVQAALVRGYIRRLEQGSLENGRPSTYGLFWRRVNAHEGGQALTWPETSPTLPVVSLDEALRSRLGKRDQVLGKKDQVPLGKRDQVPGKKGSGPWEKGIRSLGKRDQVPGKKGSGREIDNDLLKDPDLRSGRRSAASSGDPTVDPSPSPVEQTTLAKAAAAHYVESTPPEETPETRPEAARLFARVRARFPLGNTHLIGQFIAARGAFVGEVLDALVTVDGAFLKRFTRSADPAWAAFHTCCQQGILPPSARSRPSARQAKGDNAPNAPNTPNTEDQAEAHWQGLSTEAKEGELVDLWRKVYAMYQGSAPDETTSGEVAAAIAERVRAGQGRAALEHWAFADVARRRGRAIGPIRPRTEDETLGEA
jgi:hypothetical protein